LRCCTCFQHIHSCLCVLRILQIVHLKYAGRQRGMKTRPIRIMFAVTATSFLSTTLKLVSTIGPKAVGISYPLLVHETKYSRFWHALPWTSLSSFIISDGVVIWRTWILYPERQWIMILPCLLLMGTTGTFVASPLSTAFFALSFTTNAISTLLILYQLW